MPLATVHLVNLTPNTSIKSYVHSLRSSNHGQPLIISKVVRWIITPATLSVSELLSTQWDLLIITLASTPLDPTLLTPDHITTHWTITAGIPSSLLTNFPSKNHSLLHPDPSAIPPLTGSIASGKPRIADSAQGLELSPDFLTWSQQFAASAGGKVGRGAVSMLNLLAFKPGREAHESYLRYGKAFAERIGRNRGGTAKIVGKVVKVSPESAGAGEGGKGEDQAGWDEIALAHYPSIEHFVDMIGSEDYQEVNHKDRLPSLRDTCILFTTELDGDVLGGEEEKARL